MTTMIILDRGHRDHRLGKKSRTLRTEARLTLVLLLSRDQHHLEQHHQAIVVHRRKLLLVARRPATTAATKMFPVNSTRIRAGTRA